MFELRNNATNNLRFNQTWLAANDMKWTMIQKSNNVDYPLLLFRNGKIAVGTNSNPAYMVEVVGDVNITGNYRVNGTILKPAGAVLADTATALANPRNIAGVAFNGTADIAIDYFNLNNKPIILQPTTTNLQLVSGYTFAIPGNTSIGTTAIATNVLQVGAGGRLRISNGTTDYTLLGTIDTDGATNTSIVISGNTRSTNAGNIQYLATTSGGSHIFYTASATTRMTISSSGVNINDNLGVSGRVGIATAPHATYKLDVLGDINCSGAFRVNGAAIGNSWSGGTPTTNIYYNLGNVGIGATTTSDVDDNTVFAIPTARLYVKGGAIAAGTCDVVIRGGVAGQNNGKAKLWLAADASHSSYIQSEHTGSGNTQLTFGTANGNTLPTERMKIYNNGSVGIQNNGYAIPNNYMSAGSLTIGNHSDNYGGGQNWTTNTAGLLMECADNTEIAIHDSGVSIHSFMRYTTNGNIRMGRNMGYGVANITMSGYLEVDATILSRSAVYARNGFDAVMFADGGGMYLRFGTINTANSDYLEISASNGVTNINSGSNRAIYMRTAGYTWTFVTNSSLNPLNSSLWTVSSDQRIKENIKKSNLQTCYDNVKNINLYRYNYINGFNNKIKDKTQLGFIAQQVHQHFPKSVSREKIRIEDKREIPDLLNIDVAQVNFTLFGAVKQLMKVVEKQSKRIKKLEEMLGIIDDDEVENDADEPYERIVCDEVDIDTIEPSEPVGV